MRSRNPKLVFLKMSNIRSHLEIQNGHQLNMGISYNCHQDIEVHFWCLWLHCWCRGMRNLYFWRCQILAAILFFKMAANLPCFLEYNWWLDTKNHPFCVFKHIYGVKVCEMSFSCRCQVIVCHFEIQNSHHFSMFVYPLIILPI